MRIGKVLSSREAVLECDQLRQTGRRRTLHLGQSVTKRAFCYDRLEDRGAGRGDKRRRKTEKESGGDRRAAVGRRGQSPEAAAAAWTGCYSALMELGLCLSSTLS